MGARSGKWKLGSELSTFQTWHRTSCAAEASYHLRLATDLGYVGAEDSCTLPEGYDRIGRMLTRLAQALS